MKIKILSEELSSDQNQIKETVVKALLIYSPTQTIAWRGYGKIDITSQFAVEYVGGIGFNLDDINFGSTVVAQKRTECITKAKQEGTNNSTIKSGDGFIKLFYTVKTKDKRYVSFLLVEGAGEIGITYAFDTQAEAEDGALSAQTPQTKKWDVNLEQRKTFQNETATWARDQLIDGLVETGLVQKNTAIKIADTIVSHPFGSAILVFFGVPLVVNLLTAGVGSLASGVGSLGKGAAGMFSGLFSGGGGSSGSGGFADILKLMFAGVAGYSLYQYATGGDPDPRGLLTAIGFEDTFEFGKAKVPSPEFKKFQRCLIRFAGGNLAAEREKLDPQQYLKVLNPWAPGYKAYFGEWGKQGQDPKNSPPIIKAGVADDGVFGDKTLEAIMILAEDINKINGDNMLKNPKSIPLRIINSPACKAYQVENILPWEKARMDALKADPNLVPFDPSTQRPTDIPTAQAAGGALGTRSITAGGIQLDKIEASTEYQNLKKAAEAGIAKNTTLVSTAIKNNFEKINNKLTDLAEAYNTKSMDKQKLQAELENAIREASGTQTLGDTDAEAFKTAALAFFNYLKTSLVPTLAERKIIKKKVLANNKVVKEHVSNVYKEYSFLSNKNSRLHSVLMEQLKKDLKRG